jgi:hypothetical protein
MAHCACFSLAPGSVLYLPPGHWHSVVPIEGGSISVDLRAGSLTQAKWVCEALYAALSASRDVGAMAPLCPGDAAPPSLAALAAHVADTLPTILARCQLPRCLPFERACSDGLNRGGTLSFLKRRVGDRAPLLGAEDELTLSPLLSLTLKLRDADAAPCALVVQLVGSSSLSGMEYVRYRIYTDAALHAPLAALAASGAEKVGRLQALCAKPERLRTLLRVLVHAHVLHCMSSAPATAEGTRAGSEPRAQPSKRAAASGLKRRRPSM